jgi:alpha-1,6-mannosyltransferase
MPWLAPVSEDRRLGLLGLGCLAMAVVIAIAIVLPGSVIEINEGDPSDNPMTFIYDTGLSHLMFVIALATLIGLFFLCVMASRDLGSGRPAWLVLVGTAVLAAVFIPAYPAGSDDIYHNAADARTLWIHHENPFRVPPAAHNDSPIVEAVSSFRTISSRYGPLTYVAYGPPVLVAGGGVVENLLALKAYNALLLLVLTGLVGWAAAHVNPGREVQAMVIAGWNPLVLYEVVGNGHNDVLMMIFAVLGLGLLGKRDSLGLGSLGLSVAAKFVTAPLLPIALRWQWLNATPAIRRTMLRLGGLGLLLLPLLLLLFWGTVEHLADAYDIERTGRSVPALLVAILKRVELGDWNVVAGVVSWSLLGLLGLVAILRLSPTRSSLWAASFWLMVGLTVLWPGISQPWYALWFIPLGAVLAGSRAADFTVAASAAALLSYGVFPWIEGKSLYNLLYLSLVFALPALYVWCIGRFRLPIIRNVKESVGGAG